MKPLTESLEEEDLIDRVKHVIHFDEYTPKLGTDDQIIVATFKVLGLEAAKDLEGFLEKGYQWILDAETSPGEISDGYYLVFVEAERRTTFSEKFMSLVNDLQAVTTRPAEDYKMLYYKGTRQDKTVDLTLDNLTQYVPNSPKLYRDLRGAEKVLEQMLNIARVPRKKTNTAEFKMPMRKSRDDLI